MAHKALKTVGLLIAITASCILMRKFISKPEDCRSATPEDFQAFIEKSFRHKNDDPNWTRLSPGGRVDPESIAVMRPRLGILRPTSPDWVSSVSGKSNTDGRIYEYFVMYSCGHGLEYSGPTEKK